MGGKSQFLVSSLFFLLTSLLSPLIIEGTGIDIIRVLAHRSSWFAHPTALRIPDFILEII